MKRKILILTLLLLLGMLLFCVLYSEKEKHKGNTFDKDFTSMKLIGPSPDSGEVFVYDIELYSGAIVSADEISYSANQVTYTTRRGLAITLAADEVKKIRRIPVTKSVKK